MFKNKTESTPNFHSCKRSGSQSCGKGIQFKGFRLCSSGRTSSGPDVSYGMFLSSFVAFTMWWLVNRVSHSLLLLFESKEYTTIARMALQIGHEIMVAALFKAIPCLLQKREPFQKQIQFRTIDLTFLSDFETEKSRSTKLQSNWKQETCKRIHIIRRWQIFFVSKGITFTNLLQTILPPKDLFCTLHLHDLVQGLEDFSSNFRLCYVSSIVRSW